MCTVDFKDPLYIKTIIYNGLKQIFSIIYSISYLDVKL